MQRSTDVTNSTFVDDGMHRKDSLSSGECCPSRDEVDTIIPYKLEHITVVLTNVFSD
jgi:hypothetical protein